MTCAPFLLGEEVSYTGYCVSGIETLSGERDGETLLCVLIRPRVYKRSNHNFRIPCGW